MLTILYQGWNYENMFPKIGNFPYSLNDLTYIIFCTGVVRLVGGNSASEGRVEVYHDGNWGTVCDDHWHINNTKVICRMLGYGTPSIVKKGFGRGYGTIILDNVNCTGTEESIFDCQHNGYENSNCHHSEDVGVNCQGK